MEMWTNDRSTRQIAKMQNPNSPGAVRRLSFRYYAWAKYKSRLEEIQWHESVIQMCCNYHSEIRTWLFLIHILAGYRRWSDWRRITNRLWAHLLSVIASVYLPSTLKAHYLSVLCLRLPTVYSGATLTVQQPLKKPIGSIVYLTTVLR